MTTTPSPSVSVNKSEEVIEKIKLLANEKVVVSGMNGKKENIQFALPKQVRK